MFLPLESRTGKKYILTITGKQGQVTIVKKDSCTQNMGSLKNMTIRSIKWFNFANKFLIFLLFIIKI